MNRTTDWFEIMRAIASNQELFEAARPEAHKASVSIISAALKDRNLDLEMIQKIHALFNELDFTIILDHIKSAQLKAILKKIDPFNSQASTADDRWRRQRIGYLAEGGAPEEKPIAPVREKKAKKSPVRRITEETFYPESMTTAEGKRRKPS